MFYLAMFFSYLDLRIMASSASVSKTSEISTPVFNSIKSKFSKAFLYAIGAKANLGIQESGKDLDDAGIDFSIHSKECGLGRTVRSESSIIHIQLKAVSISSESMFKENENTIHYNVTKRLDPIGVFYLVVVQLPHEDEVESWMEIDADRLLIKKCAYYLRVNSSLSAGFVEIPKANLLTPDILPTLFVSGANKEANL